MCASSAACVASCEECVNPQTERGKNRALSYLFKCQIQSRLQGDRIREEREEEGRKGCNHRNSEGSQAFLSLISENTHTHISGCLDTQWGRQPEGDSDREEKEKIDWGGNEKETNVILHKEKQKSTGCASTWMDKEEWWMQQTKLGLKPDKQSIQMGISYRCQAGSWSAAFEM